MDMSLNSIEQQQYVQLPFVCVQFGGVAILQDTDTNLCVDLSVDTVPTHAGYLSQRLSDLNIGNSVDVDVCALGLQMCATLGNVKNYESRGDLLKTIGELRQALDYVEALVVAMQEEEEEAQSVQQPLTIFPPKEPKT